jgi:arylsulfatase A-like enzyme
VKNIFIFVADALRYDYLPDKVAERGDVVRTLAPGTWTPPSFSSILTGRQPINHNVDSSDDALQKDIETVFDRFESSSFIENPKDPVPAKVLKHHIASYDEPWNLGEPFVAIERSLETHNPYGKLGHKGELNSEMDEVTSGRAYYNKLRREGKWPEIYREAAEKNAEHFLSHVKKLKEENLYDDTLIIYTSDHGEFINEKSFGIPRIEHGHPFHRVLLDVPTVFLNHEVEAEVMRSIDIVPTALSILDKGLIGDGKDIRHENPKSLYCQGEGKKMQTYRWKATREGPICLEPKKLLKGKLIEDLLSLKEIMENKFCKDSEHQDETVVEQIEV